MFTALLDTCVLVPSTQRDVLLECASTGIYRPVWSQVILDELAYTLTRLLTLKGRTTDEVNAYVTRLLNQMGNAFPDALDLAPTAVLAAIYAVAARTGRHSPARSPHDLVEHLSKTGTPAFAATMLDQLTRSG